jgi:ribosomal protein L16 Arg81 hydroxylase
MTVSPGMASTIIANLFPSLGSAFVADYFPARAHVEHGDLRRLGEAFDPGVWWDPFELIASSRAGELLAYATKEGAKRRNLRVPRDVAAALFERGVTVEVPSIELLHPPLEAWTSALVDALGLPDRRHVFCHATLSIAGDALPMHFDHVDVLTVQIRGKKRWWLADNRELAAPLHSHFAGEAPRDPSYFPAALATSMPDDAQVVDMTEGSVLFTPRGRWHQTRADDVCVSLTFGVQTPSALALVLEALRAHLLRDPEWRAPIAGTRGDAVRRAAAEAKASALLRRLSGDVRGVTIEALIGPRRDLDE